MCPGVVSDTVSGSKPLGWGGIGGGEGGGEPDGREDLKDWRGEAVNGSSWSSCAILTSEGTWR